MISVTVTLSAFVNHAKDAPTITTVVTIIKSGIIIDITILKFLLLLACIVYPCFFCPCLADFYIFIYKLQSNKAFYLIFRRFFRAIFQLFENARLESRFCGVFAIVPFLRYLRFNRSFSRSRTAFTPPDCDLCDFYPTRIVLGVRLEHSLVASYLISERIARVVRLARDNSEERARKRACYID